MADLDATKPDSPPTPSFDQLIERNPKRWPNCYFDDDYVVLALGHDAFHFRIYRSILVKHSEVFRSMLESSNSESKPAKGASENNPITLPDDDPEYFAGVLSIYYGPVLVPRPQDPSFAYTIGVLRLASKYKFALAIDWATDLLREDWSPKSDSWLETIANPSQRDFEQAVALINACRETGIHEFLGCAFYLLCTDETCGDTSIYEPLQKTDVVLLMQGSRKLCRMYAEQALRSSNAKVSMAAKSLTSPFSWGSFPNHTAQAASREWTKFTCDPNTALIVTSTMGLGSPCAAAPAPSMTGPHFPPPPAADTYTLRVQENLSHTRIWKSI
ncbi:hypothetical protein BOTBODRAFT_180501 [Botryobasidium botryosum FD-172 SS1]|uniref:BTB domain-containing protein n=1 Tax=Botryobasidium botryosum (strain FD-172 SS1) TaxID=930990 RepID=A0A067M7R6_BOTB1|nr:hypothetical protein BOTBODRAFT_180501 [Botryobasidium botryosum FD-172 SS1]